ncbi:hypothetical protein B0H13DRAFT_2516286 [Mycena leptocephala]|nr:hypothetical protein B0H13DRAFT_2516286 [Mycena leptocephala]
MLRPKFSLFFGFLFANWHAVLGSYSQPPALYPRDGNSTSGSVGSGSTNFSFVIPSATNGDLSDFANWPDQITKDQCNIDGFGDWIRCPNGDVSGLLVRVAAYLANLLLGIVGMYSPEDASDAVWAQLLTVYSLLVSGIIAIGTQSLSRFHSGMTVLLVLSPLSSTLMVYAILGFCGRDHRLRNILSPSREHLLPRVLVIASWLLSLALLIFTSLANDTHFTVGSFVAIIYSLFFIPYVGVAFALLVIIGFYGPDAAGEDRTSLVVVIVGSVHPLIRQPGILWRGRTLFEERYPFLHFCGVFLIPMIYWVMMNEVRLLCTPDNLFSPSFGQVLAVFVVLQPLLQVVGMIPRAARWFSDLTFVRLITRRQRKFVRSLDLQDKNQEMDSLVKSTL